MVEAAAILASTVLVGLMVFQLALIFGVPVGRFAWGGKHDLLPVRLRIASIFSIFLYVFFALTILTQAGVTSIYGNDWTNSTIWVLTGYLFIGIFMNAISRSKSERRVMTPIAALLAALFLFVAWQVWLDDEPTKNKQSTTSQNSEFQKNAALPKIIAKNYCSDVCPQNTRTFQVYEGIKTQADCIKINGQTIKDAAWGEFIGCRTKPENQPSVVKE